MESSVFSPMAMDAIGEIVNISLGSSATAVSNMLGRRVDISTPVVRVVAAEEFTLGDLQPAVGVKINYIAGLSGSNIMLLKRTDVRAIVDILMGMETTDEEFELNELNMSAVCEVMNQMMGAASTAMSDFLNRMVNISTPEAFEIANLQEFKEEYFPAEGIMVVVSFVLKVENAIESEFMSAMTLDLASELLQGFGIDEGEMHLPQASAPAAPAASSAPLSQEEIEKLTAKAAVVKPPEPTPAPATDPEQGGRTLNQEEIERLMSGGMAAAAPSPAPAQQQMPAQQQPAPTQQMPAQMPMPQQMPADGQMPMMPPYGYPMPPQGMPYMYGAYPPMYPAQQPAPEPKKIQTERPNMPHLESETTLNDEQASNLDLIMAVPVDVSVEIGRTRRKVREILNYTKGSLVVLDRLAGDQVDLFVNGKCVARGDVVVVDDSFGLRITEIVQQLDLEDIKQ